MEEVTNTKMRSKCLKIHGDTAQKQWTFVRVFLVIGPACTSRKGTDIKEPRMKKETATSGRELKILSLEVHILTPIKRMKEAAMGMPSMAMKGIIRSNLVIHRLRMKRIHG
uniref:Uncharacterized protein n=1 Tax=Vitis vinifera TaxID=29760 RepID=F6I7G4_VITVI